jgi:hypothetical protein
MNSSAGAISFSPFDVSIFQNRTPRRWQWILEGDIRNCFDAISHDWLIAHVPMDRATLQKWLKAGYMDKCVFHPKVDVTSLAVTFKMLPAHGKLPSDDAGRHRHARAVWTKGKQTGCLKFPIVLLS